MFQPDKLADLLAPAAPVQDPFSLDALIAWLRTKPGAQEYCYLNSGACLLHQYGQSIGMKEGGGSPLRPYQSIWDQIRHRFSFDADGRIASPLPRTFSAALDRAIAIRGGQS